MHRAAKKNTKKNKKITESKKIDVRHLELEDYLGLCDSMTEAYKNWHGLVWTKDQIKLLLQIFPEGQIVVLFNEKVVGVALSIVVNYNNFGDDHTYQQITGDYTFNTHTSSGDVLY